MSMDSVNHLAMLEDGVNPTWVIKCLLPAFKSAQTLRAKSGKAPTWHWFCSQLWFQVPLTAGLSVLAAHGCWQQPPPAGEAEQKGWSTAPIQMRRQEISHFEIPNNRHCKLSSLYPRETQMPCKGERGRKENLPWTPKWIICLLGRRQHISFGKSLVTKKKPVIKGWQMTFWSLTKFNKQFSPKQMKTRGLTVRSSLFRHLLNVSPSEFWNI